MSRALLVAAFLTVAFDVRANARQELVGDGFELGRAALSPAGDRFLLVPDAGIGQQPLRVFLAAEIGHRLLSLSGSTATSSSDFSRLHIGTSWSLCPYFLVSAELPLVLREDVTVVDPAHEIPLLRLNKNSKVDAGDAVLGWRATVPGLNTPALRLGVLGRLWIPTGSQGDLTGDGTAGGRAELVTQSKLGLLQAAFAAGYEYRPPQELSGARLASGVTLGAAVGLDLDIGPVLLRPDVELVATLVAPGPNDVAFDRRSPIESAIGFVMDNGGWASSIHATQGLTQAPGLPEFRVFVTFTFVAQPLHEF